MADEKDCGNIEFWGILELFGHQRIAGFVRSVPLGGDVMLRVDVPEIKYQRRNYGSDQQPLEDVTIPPFTKFYSPKSVYAMTPVTEEAAKAAMQSFKVEPVREFDIARPALPAPMAVSSGDDDAEFDDDDAEFDYDER